MRVLRLVAVCLLLTLVFWLAACAADEPAAEAPTSTPAPSATAEPEPTTVDSIPVPPTPEPSPTPAVTVAAAVLTRELTDDAQPADPASVFFPDAPIYLSVQVPGRPTEGTISARYFFRDDLLLRLDYDLRELNEGLLFSVGEDTFVGFVLEAEAPLPISPNYRVEVLVDDVAAVDLDFSIVPPPDALPNRIVAAELAPAIDAQSNPVDPRATFAPDEVVYLVGQGDLGRNSVLRVEWLDGDEVFTAGTRSLDITENLTATSFFFNFLPEGGWQQGDYRARLFLNDEPFDTYPFTIAERQPMVVGPFDNPQPYTSTTDLVRIAIPELWTIDDNSSATAASLTWAYLPENMAVSVNVSKRVVPPDELGSTLQQGLTDTFGGQPDFQLSNPVEQGDGSVLVAFNANAGDDNSIVLRGNAYAEQRGDTFSVLVLAAPDERFAALWNEGLALIANSYQINPDAPVAP